MFEIYFKHVYHHHHNVNMSVNHIVLVFNIQKSFYLAAECSQSQPVNRPVEA